MKPAIRLATALLSVGVLLVVFPWLVGSCGGGGSSGTVERETISGKVIDGAIEGAVVCLDLGQNGRCDGDEPQARTDATGRYELAIPRGATQPLVAEMTPGVARDADAPGGVVEAPFRMASPSAAYSTVITPFTTVVHLTAQPNAALAEDMARNALGLPPRFAIKLDAPAAPGSLTQAVAKAVVAALKANGGALDLSAPDAMARFTAALPPALSDLPVLRITTKNGAPIVSKEDYVDATFVLTNPAAANPVATLSGKIRGRGHSTWGMPKNPYKVQFKEDAAYAALGDILGMRKNRNWALLADYFDRSLIRNKLAFSLGNSSVFADGLKWTPAGQHLEVVLNEDYVGVYLLAEDIRIAAERLNIRKMSADPAVNDLDGGYIVEVDTRLDCYNQGAMNLQHRTPRGVPVCIDKPDEESITPGQLAWIKGHLDAAERDLFERGALEKLNPAAFADWYLLNELFRNNDAIFYTSVFLWKDTAAATVAADRLLNMGPLWDFDLSAGNTLYNDNWMAEGCWVARSLPYWPNWITRLFDNPDFLNLVLSRWKQKRPALEAYLDAGIDTFAGRIAAAQDRNFARWQILGVTLLNHYTFATHAQEVAFVKSFLRERMAWLDKAYASPASFNALCR